jgi:hypothetical protein
MLLLLLVALAVPAVSLAGGSAGDQQYTDPFSGSSGGSHTAPTTTSSPAPATTTTSRAPVTRTASPVPAQTSAAPSSTPASGADPTTAAAVPTTGGDPTATIAGRSSTTLPYTGYDAWTAVGFGLTLVAGGAALRRRMRTRGF